MPGVIPEATGIAGGGGSVDPFGMINSLMGLKLKMNENQQFQSQYMANQALGEIIAHAPSLEEGLNQAQQNPNVMAFGGTALQTARSIRALQLQGMEIKQKLGQSGYESALQASLQAANDPLNYNRYIDNAKKLVDPEVQDRVTPQLEALRDSIAHKIQGFDLSDPGQANQAKQAITALVAGAAGAAGTDSSHLAPFLPTTEQTPEGFTVQQPSPLVRAQGGAAATPKLLPQQSAPLGTTGGEQPVLPNPATGEPMNTTGNASAQFVTNPDGTPRLDYKGSPHFKTPGLEKQNDILHDDFGGKEREQFLAAGNTRSLATQMDRAADDLNQKKGWYGTGLGGTFRGQLASLKETAEHVLGHPLTGDDTDLPAANADIAQINKIHNTLAFSLMNQYEGKGREAFGTLVTAANAIPGMENTPLAFKVLNAGIKGTADWEIGRRNFKNAWLQNPKNGGSLIGADEAYYNQAPPEKVAQKELEQFGMTLDPKGRLTFDNSDGQGDDKLERAYNNGLLGKPGSDIADAQVKKFHDLMHKGQ